MNCEPSEIYLQVRETERERALAYKLPDNTDVI